VTLTDKQRLDRIERAIAQLASAARVGFGWRPHANGQVELVEIINEQREKIEREKVKA
jgi:hypothetical protein